MKILEKWEFPQIFAIVSQLECRSKEQTNKIVTFIIHKLTSDDKIVSPWIEKEYRKCTFLNDFREANEQYLWAPFQ